MIHRQLLPPQLLHPIMKYLLNKIEDLGGLTSFYSRGLTWCENFDHFIRALVTVFRAASQTAGSKAPLTVRWV